MSMIKNIEIDGKQVPFRASAAIPRIYRMKFQRDIYKDLASLEKAIDSNTEEVSNLDLFSLEMFENIAYVMANVGTTFSATSLVKFFRNEHRTVATDTILNYQVLPKIIELWGLNVRTDAEAKKNFVQQTVR